MVGGEYGFFSRLCTPESEHCRAVEGKSAVPVADTPVLSLTLSLHTAADGGGGFVRNGTQAKTTGSDITSTLFMYSRLFPPIGGYYGKF